MSDAEATEKSFDKIRSAFTAKELAERWGMSVNAIYTARKKKLLTGFNVGGIRFSRDEVEELEGKWKKEKEAGDGRESEASPKSTGKSGKDASTSPSLPDISNVAFLRGRRIERKRTGSSPT
jgi:hypothetical protein